MAVVQVEQIIMRIGKFKIKELQNYIETNKLSEVNSTMLIILAKLANEYLAALEEEGVLNKYTTREGLSRTKKNALIDNIIPTFSMIAKILKDNNLVIPKQAIEEKEEKSEIENLLDNLNNMKKELR